MHIIDLQNKTSPREGKIEWYWFENQNVGLPRALFHRICVPLAPFDSGLDYVEQPEDTELVIDGINLGLDDPSKLDGVEITNTTHDVEASIYLGYAHNWVDINSVTLTEIGQKTFRVTADLWVEFENEGVAKNEPFTFQTVVVFVGEA